jgi:toxin-antitoxin system PIN domain toxin
MRFLVDTNVLLAAINTSAPGHDASRSLVEEILASDRPWCLSWVNVYEFLRVATHHRVFPRPLRFDQALEQLAPLLSHRYVEVLAETDRHAAVLAEIVRDAGPVSGNFVHDCHIAALMAEHDVRLIHTFDTHFRRFSRLEVVVPGADG